MDNGCDVTASLFCGAHLSRRSQVTHTQTTGIGTKRVVSLQARKAPFTGNKRLIQLLCLSQEIPVEELVVCI